MSSWRRYDAQLIPAFFERFEERWGEGSAPFLDPLRQNQPLPRAQWINVDTGAAVAVVPIWGSDETHRTFGVFYLPPAGDIWTLGPGRASYVEDALDSDKTQVSLRNDEFKKAVAHAKEFIYGPDV